MTRKLGLFSGILAACICFYGAKAHGQIDPYKRRLIQLGYNQPLEGKAPISGYGFYYYNKPEFTAEDRTLRLAIAPIYIDAELGFSELLGPNTDVAFGVAGGGFANTYSEIRRGRYIEEESFNGHGGNFSASIYHRLNPGSEIPLWAVFRGEVGRSIFDEDDTAANFELPPDHNYYSGRVGLRFGGREPSLTAPLAMELSAWYDYAFRDESEGYGFANDRNLENSTHAVWARALLKYTFPSEQLFDVSFTVGTTFEADRFGAYRLGGVLPFGSEFPLSIPGYFYQELSAENFVLLNGQYSIPLTPGKHWYADLLAAGAYIDYLPGLEMPGGHLHAGVGGGLTYASPRRSWFVTLVYGHGIRALRSHGRGANSVGVLFQYDFEARKHGRARPFTPGVGPYRSRAGERLFH
ncbi:MAG TPA: hypothetical protein VEH27_11500 [Methylomirabilota bacterium]|nr:hypothetical protein [Methylomirabilota bacterium]